MAAARLIPLLVVAGLIAALFDAGILASMLYMLVGLLIFLLWWSRTMPSMISYRRVYDTHMFWGEQATVTLEFTNKSAFALPWVQYTERLPLRLGYPAPHSGAAYLPGKSSRTLTYTVRGTRRGYYALGPLTLSFGDVFGFDDRVIRDRGADNLVVYPKVVPLSQLLLPSRMPLGPLRSRNPLSEDPVRVVGVREYQRGDSMRRVHWPASAKAGTLQVKKLEPAMTLETVVALNLHPRDYDQQFIDHFQELAIVAAASFASELVAERQAVGLLSNGADPLGGIPDRGTAISISGKHLATQVSVPAGRGRGHLIRLLEALARVESDEAVPFTRLLRDHVRGLGWGTTVVVITGSVSEELYGTLTGMRREGYAVLLVIAGHVRPAGQDFEAISAAGSFKTFRVRDDRDLPTMAEVLRG